MSNIKYLIPLDVGIIFVFQDGTIKYMTNFQIEDEIEKARQ